VVDEAGHARVHQSEADLSSKRRLMSDGPQINNRVRRGAMLGALFSCAAALLAIGVSVGLGAVFGWSASTKAVVWVVSCLLLLIVAIAAAVGLGKRIPADG
jgi:hypothetical protein